MTAIHFSASELSSLTREAALARLGEHVVQCEECHYLLALVRRANGEPSDEEREVTLDALRSWAEEAG